MWLLVNFQKIDWNVLAISACLALFGILFIFSSTQTDQQIYSVFFYKQVYGCIAGLFVYFLFCSIDFRSLCRWGYFAYFLIIFLLLFTLVKGSIGMGAQRWIDVKLFRFQPSELTKLFLPAFVVYYLQGESASRDYSMRTFMPILFIIACSFVLILKQPDLGTALIVAFSALVMLWQAGISKKFLLWGLLFGAIATPVLYKCLKPYQRKRIEVFLGEGDKQKERYHVEQSIIAIGSGGFFGKGFLQGTQNRLAFLPERRTDFIFSVLCEEWGLFGSTLVLLLYLFLIIHLLIEIVAVRSFYAQLLALGLLAPTALSVIINVGMVIGLLPVVGIPLPLMSYGLTHTLITCASLGWINGITASSLAGRE
jgi:rod shape determining protein RodA